MTKANRTHKAVVNCIAFALLLVIAIAVRFML